MTIGETRQQADDRKAMEMCEYCGKSENLVNYGGLFYCEGWCLDKAKQAEEINMKDQFREDERLFERINHGN